MNFTFENGLHLGLLVLAPLAVDHLYVLQPDQLLPRALIGRLIVQFRLIGCSLPAPALVLPHALHLLAQLCRV
jgi:hypothetical protein